MAPPWQLYPLLSRATVYLMIQADLALFCRSSRVELSGGLSAQQAGTSLLHGVAIIEEETPQTLVNLCKNVFCLSI